jgi:hypothetical protein
LPALPSVTNVLDEYNLLTRSSRQHKIPPADRVGSLVLLPHERLLCLTAEQVTGKVSGGGTLWHGLQPIYWR